MTGKLETSVDRAVKRQFGTWWVERRRESFKLTISAVHMAIQEQDILSQKISVKSFNDEVENFVGNSSVEKLIWKN